MTGMHTDHPELYSNIHKNIRFLIQDTIHTGGFYCRLGRQSAKCCQKMGERGDCFNKMTKNDFPQEFVEKRLEKRNICAIVIVSVNRLKANSPETFFETKNKRKEEKQTNENNKKNPKHAPVLGNGDRIYPHLYHTGPCSGNHPGNLHFP